MAKKSPKQTKPKTGLSRCLELASNKKGLVFLSAILSSLASIASFVPTLILFHYYFDYSGLSQFR